MWMTQAVEGGASQPPSTSAKGRAPTPRPPPLAKGGRKGKGVGGAIQPPLPPFPSQSEDSATENE